MGTRSHRLPAPENDKKPISPWGFFLKVRKN